jgi:hypothetical protein
VGTDYLNRTGTAKSNMYDNRPKETKYIYTDERKKGKLTETTPLYALLISPCETR